MTFMADLGTKVDYYAQSIYYYDIDIYIIMTVFAALIAIFTIKSFSHLHRLLGRNLCHSCREKLCSYLENPNGGGE